MSRVLVVNDLASRIAALDHSRPIRVAVDGVDAAGKTMLADELVAPLEQLGCVVTRISADSFLNPPEIRYRLGRDSAEGFYRDSFDHGAIVAAVMSTTDAGAVVLIDGIFLLRPELRDLWDFSILVRASFAVTVGRAEVRETPRLGSVDAVRDRYARRYVPGQLLYFAEAQPERHASVIVDNDDVERPLIVPVSSGRGVRDHD